MQTKNISWRKAACLSLLLATAIFTFSNSANAAFAVSASPASLKINETATLTVTGADGPGAITYTKISGPCTIATDKVTATGVGDCKVRANQAASMPYSSQTADLTIKIVETTPNSSENSLNYQTTGQIEALARMQQGQISNLQQHFAKLHNGVRSGFDLSLRLTSKAQPQDSKPASQPQAHFSLPNSEPSSMAGWISATLATGKQDGQSGSTTSRNQFNTQGVTMGYDFGFSDDLTLGIAAGYDKSKADFDNLGSNADGATLSAMFYGSLQLRENNFLDFLAGYGQGSADMNRWSQSGQTRLSGARDNRQFFGSVIYSAEYEIPQGIRLTPSAGVEANRINLDAYQETGSTNWSLAYKAMHMQSFTAIAGLKLEKDMHYAGMKLSPSAHAQVRQSLSGSFNQNFSYANTQTGNSYKIAQEQSKATALLVGVGLLAITSKASSLDIGYDFTADVNGDNNLIAHQVSGTYRLEF